MRSSVHGAGVNRHCCKMSTTLFLRSLALCVPIYRLFQSNGFGVGLPKLCVLLGLLTKVAASSYKIHRSIPFVGWWRALVLPKRMCLQSFKRRDPQRIRNKKGSSKKGRKRDGTFVTFNKLSIRIILNIQ